MLCSLSARSLSSPVRLRAIYNAWFNVFAASTTANLRLQDLFIAALSVVLDSEVPAPLSTLKAHLPIVRLPSRPPLPLLSNHNAAHTSGTSNDGCNQVRCGCDDVRFRWFGSCV